MATEQKAVDPNEIECEEPANNEEEPKVSWESSTKYAHMAFPDKDFVSGMSSRAGAVKDHLLSKAEVTAILLKADGTSEEIQSGASSQQIRSLLSGKATVVGELEELHIVVLRSADSNESLNKHQLPVPLCHGSFNGDYLLIRMDSTGKPVDLSLAEYTKYVEDHKTLTETAVKNFSSESLQIKSRSPFGTDAKDIRTQLMAEIECKLRGDKDSDTAPPTDSQVRKSVEKAILELVDSTIAGWSASPMEDPDYVQEEEHSASDRVDEEEEEEETAVVAVEELDDRSWRDQLNDALQHVRDIGKADGQVFAQRLSETFYEINGEQPSADQMQRVFSDIKNDFAFEAAQERNEENVEQQQPALDGIDEERDEQDAEDQDEESSPEGSEAEEVDDAVAQQEDDDVTADEEEEDEMSPLETLKFATETIGNDWVSRAQSMWKNQRGREPTERELAHTVKQLAQDFADSVLDITEQAVAEQIKTQNIEEEECSEEDTESDIEVDLDEDYDPDNVDDVEMAEVDATENQRYDDFHFDDMMLTTEVVKSKKDSGCSWKVYFEESELSEVVETANLEEAISQFQAVNKREPTALELHNMKLFLSVPNEVGDEMEDDAANVITTKTGAASWNVSFEGDEISALKAARNLKDAVKGFKVRNNREPTRSEMAHIRSFVGGHDSADVVAEQEVSRSPSKVLVTPVQTRNGSVTLSVYLEGNRYSQQEREQLAIRCFKKFNKRDPNEEDMERIRTFIQTDTQQLTEQTYLVPEKMGSLEDDAVLDDQKEMDVVVRASTKKEVTKKTATGYLLDFEDETKREHGDEKMAKQWFQRFNNRDPNEEEEEQIRQFVASERVDQELQQMIDID